MKRFVRKVSDRAATGCGFAAVLLAAAALVVLLAPIFTKGAGAVVFRATGEHRRMLFEQFRIGDAARVAREREERQAAFAPVCAAMRKFEDTELPALDAERRRELREAHEAFKEAFRKLAGPLPGEARPALPRDQYGAMRLDKAREALRDILYEETWVYPTDARGRAGVGQRVFTPRAERFAGTSLAEALAYLEAHGLRATQPKWTCYHQFFTLPSKDSHFFGGIWPELKGTFLLTLLAILAAAPVGVLTAVYLAEYTRQGWFVALLRLCVNTLAGVPSIVFGLFGLAFFIVAVHVSPGKSVLAGSLTLALLVLPTIIRSSEEAVAAVPVSYREAALGLGAGKWRTVLTVVLPAALPRILTGVVISMGRAAGETAPIIFTAAVSAGPALRLAALRTMPTPALSWNIYNLASEHEAADALRHVQYGMVATLIMLVLAMNLAAIFIRTRINKKLQGA